MNNEIWPKNGAFAAKRLSGTRVARIPVCWDVIQTIIYIFAVLPQRAITKTTQQS